MNMRALLLLLCAALTACASGPKYTEVERSIPALQSGMGRIYFYRSSVFGAAFAPSILLNGRVVGEMVSLGFFYVDREPGVHVASARTETATSVEIPLEANQTHYVRGSIYWGLIEGRPQLDLVAATTGMQEIRGLRYVGTAPLIAGAVPDALPAAAPLGSDGTKLKDLDGLFTSGGNK
jgi:hypothetical protein